MIPDEHEEMVEYCLDRSDKLNDLDTEFLEDMEEQLDAGYKLSQRQALRLEHILERVTARGL